jgi:hypothetical protein
MLERILVETDKRLLWKLAWNMGFKGMLSVEKHKRRLKKGEVFPPFLYVSVINSCNLRCQGCWVDVAEKMEAMAPETEPTPLRELLYYLVDTVLERAEPESPEALPQLEQLPLVHA